MNIPIETVVELLMANCSDNYSDSLGGSWQEYSVASLSGTSIRTGTRSELRHKLRDYLSTLVPKPKLLSECEEKARHWAWLNNEPRQMYRMADKAYLGDDRTLSWMPICPADQVQVIQPVERGDE